MALTYADFIEPAGKLTTELFPGKNLATLLQGWLATATTKAAAVDATFRDAATEDYVYYLAYSTVADRLAGEPNSASVDAAANVSRSIGQDRIAYFARKAQQHLDDFESYITTISDPHKPRSTWLQNRIVF